jgi:hypothetical protein
LCPACFALFFCRGDFERQNAFFHFETAFAAGNQWHFGTSTGRTEMIKLLRAHIYGNFECFWPSFCQGQNASQSAQNHPTTSPGTKTMLDVTPEPRELRS